MPAVAALLLAASVALLLPLGGGGWKPEHRLVMALVVAVAAAFAAMSRATLDRRAMAVLAGVSLLLCDAAARAWTAPLAGPAEQRLALDVLLAGTLIAGMMAAATEAALLADVVLAGLLVLGLAALVAAPGLESMAWPFASHASLGATLAAGAVLGFDLPGADGAKKSSLLGLRLAASAVLVVAVAATQSRSAMVAVGLMLAVVAWRRRRAAGLAILAFLFAMVAWVGASGRWDPVAVAASAPVTDRLVVWRASLALVAEHPWWGSGLGTFGSAIWRFTPDSLGGAVEHAHSEPLEVLVERGATGLMAAAFVLVLLVRAAGRTATSRRLLVAGLVPLVAGMVDVSLDLPGPALLAVLLLGAAVGADCRSRAQGATERSGLLLAFVLAGGSAIVAAAGFPPRAHPGDDRLDPFAALAQASAFEESGEFEAAEAEFLRARGLFPLGAAPQEARIGFLVRRGRLAEALALAVEVARAHPARAATLAIATAKTLEHPALAESLAPETGEGRREVARWLAGQGASGSASALRLLATLPLESASDRRLLASALASAGRHADGRAALSPVEDTESRVLLASLATDPASIAEAIANLESAPRPDGRHDEREETALIALLDRAGRPQDAMQRLDRAIESLPGSATLCELRAARRAAAGDVGGAMDDARRLIELTPRGTRGRLMLARLLETRGMTAGARALYAEALAVAPGNVEAAAGLARLRSIPLSAVPNE